MQGCKNRLPQPRPRDLYDVKFHVPFLKQTPPPDTLRPATPLGLHPVPARRYRCLRRAAPRLAARHSARGTTELRALLRTSAVPARNARPGWALFVRVLPRGGATAG